MLKSVSPDLTVCVALMLPDEEDDEEEWEPPPEEPPFFCPTLRDLPTTMVLDLSPFQALIWLTVVPYLLAILPSVSPLLTLW